MGRIVPIALAVVISASLLVYAGWGVDFSRLGTLLGAARYDLAVPFFASLFPLYLLKAARWVQILSPLRRFSVPAVAPALMIGLATNNLLPARLGELVRCVVFTREHRQPFTAVLTSVALERLLDMVAVLLLYVLAIALSSDPPEAIRFTIWPMVLACVAAFCATYAVLEAPDRVARWWHWMARPLPRWLRVRSEQAVRDAIRALGSVRSLPVLLVMLASSLLQWGIIALTVWISLRALGSTIPASAAVVVMAAMVLASMLPNAPGYIGAIQAAYLIALTPFGVAQELALAASVLYTAGHWLPVTALGVLYVCLDGADGGGARWKLLRIRSG